VGRPRQPRIFRIASGGFIAASILIKPAGEDAWVETYLKDISDYGRDSPPGDEYHKWGFQGDRRIPREVKEKLEDAIFQGKDGFSCKGWTLRLCKRESA